MKSKRLLVALAAIALLGLVIMAVAVFVVVPRLVEREVVRRAREQGVELELGSLEFGWEWVRLAKSRGRLVGVSRVELAFDEIDVKLRRFELGSLELEGVAVTAQGTLPVLALELGAWSKRFPAAFALPLSARGVSVDWRPDPREAPWLSVQGASIGRTSAGTVVVAEQARIAGTDVGRVGAVWSATASSVALGLGETELGKAPLRIAVETVQQPKVRLTLAPLPLERLAGPFATALPVKDVVVSAEVGLDFAARDALTPSFGRARVELKGYIPPHPVELDGFVFGDVTLFETDFHVADNLREATLENTSVTAGRFVLKGSGNVVRDDATTRAKLDLRGALPCDALASAAAQSRLGRLLGRGAGKKAGIAAHRIVGGEVAVRVQIDANTSDLPGATLTRSIGIGCGLKPLTLEDLQKLGEQLFSSDLSRLPEDLGKLLPPGPSPIPSRFPPLPSGFPSGFPKIPSGFPRLPSAPSAKPS